MLACVYTFFCFTYMYTICNDTAIDVLLWVILFFYPVAKSVSIIVRSHFIAAIGRERKERTQKHEKQGAAAGLAYFTFFAITAAGNNN